MRWNAFCSGLVVSGNGSADITRPGTPVVTIQGTGDLPWHPPDAVQAAPVQPAPIRKPRELFPKRTTNPNGYKYR